MTIDMVGYEEAKKEAVVSMMLSVCLLLFAFKLDLMMIHPALHRSLTSQVDDRTSVLR